MSSITFAAITGSVRYGESTIRLVAGQPWDGDDPFVKQRPDLFDSTPSFVHRTAPTGVIVEQATRAPGERRTTKRDR